VISHKNHFYHVICLLKTFSRSPLFIRCGIKSPLLGFKANSDTISILCFHKSTCLFPPSNPYSSIFNSQNRFGFQENSQMTLL
jgi:hypothetical protein